MSDLLRIGIVIVVVVLLIARRMAGEPLQPTRVFLLPPVFLAIGVYDFAKSAHGGLRAADLTFLAVDVLVGLAFGVARGMSVGLFERDGHLWMRYRVRTILLWLLLVGVRLLLNLAGQAAGAHVAGANTTLVMMFGLTLAAESVVLAIRAHGSGVPYAPAQIGGRGPGGFSGGSPRSGGSAGSVFGRGGGPGIGGLGGGPLRRGRSRF